MSHSRSPVESGYLLLADISGYTAFLAQTELEHANEILSDLLETVLNGLKGLLMIHKIEGDCVFAYSSDASVIRGETLLELIEATYADFRARIKNVRRHSTCTCRACESIPMLDLKFMTHYGEYAVQSVGGARELAGSAVNLAHRLLKNHVAERTGWRAYALFTQAALNRMGLQLEGLAESIESYEHLGETRVFAMDMHARHESILQNRRVVVEPGQALYTFSEIFHAPPPVVWTWLNDPAKRRLYLPGNSAPEFVPVLRPGGRTVPGAVTHCVHGSKVEMRETVLDWKPFEYYTVEQDNGRMGVVQVTYGLEPVGDDQTRLSIHLTGHMPKWPQFLGRQAIKFMFTRLFSYGKVALKAKELIELEAAGASPP
jgi:class 3 adenylate cyclase